MIMVGIGLLIVDFIKWRWLMKRRIFLKKSGYVGFVLSLVIGNVFVEWEESVV